MSQRLFFVLLLVITAATAAGLFFVGRLPQMEEARGLSWFALAFFVGLSIGMYYAGLRAARSENKHLFTNLVMVFTFGKMMFAVLLILSYLKLFQPATKLFLLPFFGIYLIYTIFETYFMLRLGRMSS